MIEIPNIKIELYVKNKKKFAEELDSLLKEFRVAQINGLEQQLLDDLYGYMQDHAAELRNRDIDEYCRKQFYRQGFQFSPAQSRERYLRRNRPELNAMLKTIKKNMADIADPVTKAIRSQYKMFFEKPREILLLEYYPGYGIKCPGDENRKVMIRLHSDEQSSLVIATSSAPGLQGEINGKMVPLQPEKNHALIWTGGELEAFLKPLYHRVVYPETDRYALLYI